jgi:superoxide dismutase, Cu-Zn family
VSHVRRLLAMPILPLVAALAVACGDDDVASGGNEGPEGPAGAGSDGPGATAELRNPGGTTVGEVAFHDDGEATRVTVEINGLDAEPGFHAFHVHANDDPSNGEGCEAEPGQPADTWFTSADSHLSAAGQHHGAHEGDLPTLLILPDGSARAEFVTDRFSVDDIGGAAVVVHADPDNFGNVPTGGDAEQYRPNDQAARTLTANTGNAGDRLACGVVEAGGG